MPHGGGGGGFSGSAGSGASFTSGGGGGGGGGGLGIRGSSAVILIIVGYLSCVAFFPFFGRQDYNEMIKGENFKFHFAPFWHASLTVSSDTEKNVQSLFYYEDCPKSATEFREISFTNDISSKRYHYDGFYLNKNSVSNLTWQTSSPVVFEIFDGEKSYDKGTPTYHHKKSTGQTGFIFNAKETGYYIFYWDLGSSKKYIGKAQWNFTLTAYNTLEANAECPLGESLPPCTFEYHHSSSCVVIDTYDLDYEEDIHIRVSVDGRVGRYFLIVIAPTVIISVLLYCAFVTFVTWAEKSLCEER